jgi:PncC family amidohydrolase
VATAEATTGGLIGHALTEISGASAVFRAGVAPYSNDAKLRLGVSPAVLEQYGAVSRETAAALAVAGRQWASADIGLAETGIAGPDGTPDRPVGLFWVSIATRNRVTTERFTFHHDRSTNRRLCAEVALRMLLAFLATVPQK